MTAFRVGQRVVFVNAADIPNPWHRSNPLTVGQVYEVLRICSYHVDHEQMIVVDGTGMHWNASRFRPAVSRPTSIAVFQAMLTGKKAGVEA